MDERTLREQLQTHIDTLDAEQLPAAIEAIEALATRPTAAGTYPPRMVTPRASFWLREGETVTLVRDALFARRHGEVCTLVCASAVADVVWVNGKRLYGTEHDLQDGDFVQCEGERFFFQADPVADKLARAGAPRPPGYISDAVRRRVLLDDEGVTLFARVEGTDDKHVRWDEINYLRVTTYEGTTSIYVNTFDPSAGVVSNFSRLFKTTFSGKSSIGGASFTSATMPGFVEWLHAAAPFDLSIYGGYHFRRLFADPYLMLAERLIEQGGASLPADADFIRGKPLSQQTRLLWAGVVASVLMTLFGCSVLIVMSGSASLSGLPFILPALLVVGGMVLMAFVGVQLERQYHAWREPNPGVLEKWLTPKDKR
jgi:hypothetical protein